MVRQVVLLCCVMTVIWGCSDSGGPTKDNGDTAKPSTVQQTVGTSGGTVESRGMALEIPDGLLNAETEITLSETVETTFAEDTLTPTYTIEGLPVSFTGTATVKIKYDGEAPDVISVATGEEHENIVDGKADVFYDLVAAQVETGWIICDLSSGLIPGKYSGQVEKRSFATEDIGTQLKRYIKAVKNTKKSPHDWFMVYYNTLWEDSAPYVGAYLEDAMVKFMEAGFEFRSKNNTTISSDYIKVHIKEVSDSSNKIAGYLKQNTEGGYSAVFDFDFDESVLGTTEEKRNLMKIEAGKKVFSMFTYLAAPQTYNQDTQNYFLRALHEWAGSKILDDDTYVPEYFQGNENFPLLGLKTGKTEYGTTSKKFGDCMSALVKYLDKTNGGDGSVIKSALDRIADSKDGITALLQSIPKTEDVWWPEFIQSYLAGDVYPVDIDKIFSSTSGSYSINSSAQETKTFSNSYGDLSAKIYKIDLTYNDSDPDREFTFKVGGEINTDYLTVLLYKKDNSGNITFFEKGTEITITSLKEFIAQETNELYAVVVNSACIAPYTGSYTISLNITTEEKSDLPSAPIVDPNLIFVTIPGGSFDMGSDEGSTVNQPVHRVRLDGFEMTQTEITNEQFVCFLNAALATGDILVETFDDTDKTVYVPFTLNMWGTKSERIIDLYNSIQQDNFGDISYSPTSYFTVQDGKNRHPVKRVSWYGAVAFAEYYEYRLPTEAEWEYACRAGTTTKYYTGDDDESVLDAAWCWDNTWDGEKRSTRPVGLKTPNNWGLYDMHGNVREWCYDHYNPRYYDESPEYNPTGPESGSWRVLRGGTASGSGLTSWSRDYQTPGTTSEYNGFRIVSD
ncbi:MAG: SUMF1/EgtB/PvdO family nonheme iron enzyme [Candidatus Latescibacteria bacterium]|nr:SUMF1/EgtB/PvdO family nonheme iron enzyme [Candidatus Latescibacterota bacterium]